MNNFGACRMASGKTQKEVAIALKVSIQAVSYWETGERMPTYEKLIQLADLYGVSTDCLLGRVMPPSIATLHGDVDSNLSESEEEKALITAYRKADPAIKRAVCDVLHIAFRSSQREAL